MSQHTPVCDCGGGQDPAVYHDRPCPMWRLMTAAPELLAALKAKLVCRPACGHLWCDTARAAIAKATGG